MNTPVRTEGLTHDMRRKTRTSVPGVYRRGNRYVAVYRDAFGTQRKKFYETLDDAANGKRALERAAWDVRLVQRREERRKSEARITAAGKSVDDAYLSLRKTIATLDIAHSATSGRKRRKVGAIIASLYRVEDDLTATMREFPA